MLRSILGRRARRLQAVLAVSIVAVAAGLAPAGASAATLVKTIGFPGPAGLYAYGMDWDKSDNTILVGDYWNYRVQRYSITGTKLATYSDMTGPKANGGIPSAPYDIAADPTDPADGGAS